MGDAIVIEGVTKVYGDGLKALDDISLRIPRGMFFGLLGPNGAGKTTLISILGGLTRPTTGSAQIMGCDVVADPLAARRQIGIVPQEIVYDHFFSAKQYLMQQSRYYGIFDNEAWVDELLGHLGLQEKSRTNTRALSGGMKRRLMAAMAMVHRPPVVILDEPTAGVDINQRRNLWDFIKQLNDDGVTVILTTHYLEEAEELCDRIVMLDQGRILADKSTADLLSGNLHHTKCIFVRFADDAPLPASMPFKHTSEPDRLGRYHVFVDEYSQVEQALAAIRECGLQISELDVAAADLEDVFVSLTQASQ